MDKGLGDRCPSYAGPHGLQATGGSVLGFYAHRPQGAPTNQPLDNHEHTPKAQANTGPKKTDVPAPNPGNQAHNTGGEQNRTGHDTGAPSTMVEITTEAHNPIR